MNTQIQRTGTEMTVTIEGSIDTVTAPELEQQLLAQWDGASRLVLNFAQVDYVSSAGLRVILKSQKHMAKAGKMILLNVSEDVMEVFEMTGFDELLHFE